MSDEELIKSLEERTNRLGIDIKAAVTSHQPLGHIATWPHCNCHSHAAIKLGTKCLG